MNVKELIEFLQGKPQDMKVVFQVYSEACVLETEEIEVEELCVARPDGWVHHKRPDKETETYLVFPGN